MVKIHDFFQNYLTSRQLIDKWTKPNLHQKHFRFPFFFCNNCTVIIITKKILMKQKTAKKNKALIFKIAVCTMAAKKF
jgi:hypothetical protein